MSRSINLITCEHNHSVDPLAQIVKFRTIMSWSYAMANATVRLAQPIRPYKHKNSLAKNNNTRLRFNIHFSTAFQRETDVRGLHLKLQIPSDQHDGTKLFDHLNIVLTTISKRGAQLLASVPLHSSDSEGTCGDWHRQLASPMEWNTVENEPFHASVSRQYLLPIYGNARHKQAVSHSMCPQRSAMLGDRG